MGRDRSDDERFTFGLPAKARGPDHPRRQVAINTAKRQFQPQPIPQCTIQIIHHHRQDTCHYHQDRDTRLLLLLLLRTRTRTRHHFRAATIR